MINENDVVKWSDDFTTMWEPVGCRFFRHDLRENASRYVRGLMGPVQRKNGWQIAEHMGLVTPDAVQHLLGRARWNADTVRDEVLRYAMSHMLAPGEKGVLIVDETGFLKKGDKSAGVQRQYSGTAGRIENCQVGVFLALAGSRGRALVDRALYLPKSWCDAPARCRAAGIPPEAQFATKPQLAQTMLAHAWGSGLRPAWVLADEVYGSDSKFRRFLEEQGQPYVLAVSSQQRLWVDLRQKRVDAIAKDWPEAEWFRWSVGEGLKGPRVYDWAAGRLGSASAYGLQRWLLIRRSVEHPGELAYYFCWAPEGTAPLELARAAGGRWGIECCFEAAKQETGLDEYEVRSWSGWYRHITLSMLALAFLSAVRAKAGALETEGVKKKRNR